MSADQKDVNTTNDPFEGLTLIGSGTPICNERTLRMIPLRKVAHEHGLEFIPSGVEIDNIGGLLTHEVNQT